MHSLLTFRLSSFLPSTRKKKYNPAGGYKAVDGAANDATINQAAKFAVEAVREKRIEEVS